MSQLQQQARALTPPAATALWRGAWPLALAIGLGLLMHMVIGPWSGNFATRLMLDTGVAIIAAVSLNIVNGFTGQFSIGHAAFMAAGGYVAGATTYYATMLLWGDTAQHGGLAGAGEWLFFGSCLLGGVVAAGLGWVVGLPSLRLRGDYLAIVTLGFGEILRVLLQNTNRQIFDPQMLREAPIGRILPPPLGAAQGFADIPKYSNLFWMYLLVCVTVMFAIRLKQSSSGRALLSIREDEIAAQSMGINLTRMKVRAFMYAAFFAGVAGGLFAHQSGTIIRPVDAGFQRSFEFVIMVVLGGLGSISGVVVAAIILTLLPEFLRDPTPLVALRPYVVAATLLAAGTAGMMMARGRRSRGWWLVSVWAAGLAGVMTLMDIAVRNGVDLGKYRMILYSLMLVLLMIFRPQGLFGVREIWDLPAMLRRPTRRAAA